MKKKFIIFTLCFTLIFSSLNYKKSYADGGVISLPILATVSALAVGTGIVVSGNDDLYDLGRMFYDYVYRHNDLTWSTVQSVFASSVALQPNKLVSIKSEFLDIVKEFFDNTFGSSGDLPVYTELIYPNFHPLTSGNFVYYEVFDNSTIPHGGNSYEIKLLKNDGTYHTFGNYGHGFKSLCFAPSTVYGKTTLYLINSNDEVRKFDVNLNPSETVIFSSVFSYQGGYTWDNVESKKENESVALPIPGDLSSLVGQGSTDFWDNTDNLVGSGDISIPNVDDPSISLDDTISFPNTNVDTGTGNPSIPNDSIWSNITDYIIGLVVPSDAFWTDTWGGLYNNFANSFPMVDMDGFNDLVTGEKKFPNIDINIMGVTGRVVNGDVINSIVNWLRPIIAGFMMLCLMLFNYRKIYKLIRNSEPFGGIAPGTSDFSTGISEYSKQEVVKATDMVAEYRAWKERGGK